MRYRSLVNTVGRGAGRVWPRVAQFLNTQRTGAILGTVDAPRPVHFFSHWVQVSGWAAARDGSEVRVTIALGGEEIATVRPDKVRPDVSARYPEVPAGAATGFHATIPAARLAGCQRAVLTVTVVGSGGVSRRLASILLVRSTGGRRALPRFAYGRVWDRDSRNLGDARNAVAGYADEAEWQRTGVSTATHIASRTRITADDVVLEIGCGAGRVGTHLAPQCRLWMGGDVSRNMLDYAADALKAAGRDNVQLVHLNGMDLTGIASSSVDVVYCSAVFMHLEEWERFRYISDALRVLRPGGRLYVDNFDLGSTMGWQLFLDTAALDPMHRPPNVSKSSTGEELQVYAEKAGFTNIALERGAMFVTVTAEKPPD